MNYIIDGYNLAFKVNKIAREIKNGKTDLAIQEIIRFIRSKINLPKNQVLLILDGKAGLSMHNFNSPGIKIIFSKKPETADDKIRKFIRTRKNIKQWCVVSSDNEILFTAQDHRAKTMKSDDFIKLKSKSGDQQPDSYKKKTNPENIDLEYWRSIFGIDKK